MCGTFECKRIDDGVVVYRSGALFAGVLFGIALTTVFQTLLTSGKYKCNYCYYPILFLTTMWRSLTNEQILAWNKLALSQEAKSVLGTKGKISGANLFTRLNYWIVACGGSALTTPPTLVGVETPGACTIVCTGSAFTFKLDAVPTDVTNLKLVIEATEGQSNGVSRAYSKAAQIKMVSSPSTSAVDIKSDYEAKNGVLGAGAPKVFFRYYFVNSATGEKSGIMLASVTWTAGE